MKTTLIIVFINLLVAGCTAAPVYTGPKSDHFNGSVFKNHLSAEKNFADIFRLSATYPFKKTRWPKKTEGPAADPVTNIVRKGIAATLINHSTVLLQVDGINILTDPVFSQRASPFSRIGPKRVTPPAISIAELPPIDVILISHNHYDHLDIASLTSILSRDKQRSAPLILAGLGNGGLFDKHKIENYRDLDWGQAEKYRQITFEFVETRHRSGRGISDQMKTLWGGFVIQTAAGNIYFGGDTGYGPHFRETRARFNTFALALIPIGAYEPRWFMEPVHLNPEDAVLAHNDLNSDLSIAIHHSTFQLTHEGIDQPKTDLEIAIKKHSIANSSFITPAFGEKVVIE